MNNKQRSMAQIDCVNYILGTESEDYFTWCQENNLDIDSTEAMEKHIYGKACQAMGRLPSYYLS